MVSKPMPEGQEWRLKEEYWHPKKGCWITRKKKGQEKKYTEEEAKQRRRDAQKKYRISLKRRNRRYSKKPAKPEITDPEQGFVMPGFECTPHAIKGKEDGLYAIQNGRLYKVQKDMEFDAPGEGCQIYLNFVIKRDKVIQ